MTQVKIPGDWLPNVNMKRIILHWTGGTHNANSTDKKHYHVLIEGNGKLVRGRFAISANVRPQQGKYAAHTKGCNTGSIGVSVCCMYKATEIPFDSGKYPFKKVQWDAMVRITAQLCKFYAIPVTPMTVLSHAEVEQTLGVKQRNKWDIARLSFDLKLKGARRIGDEFRRQVQREMDNGIKPEPKPIESGPEVPEPTLPPPPPPSRQPDDPGVKDEKPKVSYQPSLWERFLSWLGLKNLTRGKD